ncbi:MAG: DUF3419 family protein [Pyrinomonadaceae bacterium]
MKVSELSSAVQSDSLATRRGMLQKLFSIWFEGFIYNQIWEDPRVDLAALEIDGSSRVLTISSGGCNALNYLLADPESVTAVDLNRCHIYLLDLKIAAVRHLPGYEDFFELFGLGRSRNAGSHYLRYIAPHLNKDAREFWGSNTILGSLLFGDRISYFSNGGLYDHSRNGYFLRFFHRVSHLSGLDPGRILDAKTPAEQEAVFKEQIGPFFDTLLVRAIGKLPVTVFGLGIPPQQFDELKADLTDGATVIDIFRERVHRLACGSPIAENYFAWQAFARRYDAEDRLAVPDYLKEENYELLKARIGRLSTSIASVTDVISNEPEGAFDRFVLLDAQDWMNAEQLTSLWTAIAEKTGSGARIIFRTAAADSPLERNLPPEIMNEFHYEAERSKELFPLDRASIYGGFHLYIRK